MFFASFQPDPVSGKPPKEWLLTTAQSIRDVRRWFCVGQSPFSPGTEVRVALAFGAGRNAKAAKWTHTATTPTAVCSTRGTGKKSPSDLTGGAICVAYVKLVRETVDSQKPEKLVVYVHEEHAVNAAKGIQLALLEAGFMKTDKDAYLGPDQVAIVPCDGESSSWFEANIWFGLELGAAANLQRWLTALPLNHLGIESYAELVYDLFRETRGDPNNVYVSEPSDADMDRMRLLQETCRASGRKPRVLLITLHPLAGQTSLIRYAALKGLVMDNGGEDLKISGAIRSMKGDMSASAAGLGAALFYKDHPELLGQSAVFALMLAENRIDGDGCAVQDIVTTFDGKTHEDENTDAEGRKGLADVAAYLGEMLREKVAPDPVTMATLTGAVIVTFGDRVSSIMVRNNDRGYFDWAEDKGDAIYDSMHRLRLTDQHYGDTSSDIADYRNVTGTADKNSGSQRGGAFIMRHHVPAATHAVHVDIARAVLKGEGQISGMPQHAGTWFLIEHFRRPPMEVSAT